jgi:hypothetical protein
VPVKYVFAEKESKTKPALLEASLSPAQRLNRTRSAGYYRRAGGVSYSEITCNDWNCKSTKALSIYIRLIL